MPVAIREYIATKNCSNAVVVGAGFIGLEMAENLMNLNIQVTVIDMMHQILPNILDEDMAGYAAKHLRSKGMKLMLGTSVQSIGGATEAALVVTNAGTVSALVILCIGIRPATAFLEGSGIELLKGNIVVDEFQKTNLEDIYAVGDCTVVRNRIPGQDNGLLWDQLQILRPEYWQKQLPERGRLIRGVLGPE